VQNALLLTGFRPVDPGATRSEQARDVFEQMERTLQEAGRDFSQVVRTWFYLQDILGWYGDFNAVRTKFFGERGVFQGLVPASTGIGLPDLDGVALTAGLLAIAPGTAQVEAVASPLQCEALDYQSSFSRAVEIVTPNVRRILVSGTASIDDAGRTAYVGDVDRQIELTISVVDALLVSRSMDWKDVTRAVAYAPVLRDAVRSEALLKSMGMPDGVFRPLESVVCRDDLLFELELDAVQTTA
jgi:enamine deaminase RidA (YjgF/YER057c/UK114 family)